MEFVIQDERCLIVLKVNKWMFTGCSNRSTWVIFSLQTDRLCSAKNSIHNKMKINY